MGFEIKNTKETITNDGVKILIYGNSGVGKTSQLGTLEGKTLILSAESGLLVLKNKSIDVIDILDTETLGQVYLALKKGELKYDNVCIDSLSEIGEMIVKELDSDSYYGDATNTFPMWKEYSKRITNIVKAFRDLKGFNVIFTALSEPVEANGAIRYMPMIPARKAQSKLISLFDEVYYYVLNKDQQRVIHTSTSSTFDAKSRLGMEKEIIVSEDLNLGSMLSKFNKTK